METKTAADAPKPLPDEAASLVSMIRNSISPDVREAAARALFYTGSYAGFCDAQTIYERHRLPPAQAATLNHISNLMEQPQVAP